LNSLLILSDHHQKTLLCESSYLYVYLITLVPQFRMFWHTTPNWCLHMWNIIMYQQIL